MLRKFIEDKNHDGIWSLRFGFKTHWVCTRSSLHTPQACLSSVQNHQQWAPPMPEDFPSVPWHTGTLSAQAHLGSQETVIPTNSPTLMLESKSLLSLVNLYTCPFHFLKNALFTSPESFFFWPNDYFSHHFPRRVLNGILHFLQHSKSSTGNLENTGISADFRQISKSLVLQRLKPEIQLLSPCLSLLSIMLL